MGEPLEEAAEILHEKLEVLPREIGWLYWPQFKILLRVIEEKEQVKEIKTGCFVGIRTSTCNDL
jgi:hypothetical protein